MTDLKLYMLLLGCKPQGRHTEQHDVFFGIGASLKDMVPDIVDFWPEADGKIHIDAWREVTVVDGYAIDIGLRSRVLERNDHGKLFFVNLGGYKENDFEEYHYKCLSVGTTAADAIRQAKEQTFWKHNVSSHIDDKYGIDVDDVYEIEEVLAPRLKEKYTVIIGDRDTARPDDELHPGYLKLNKLADR